MATVSYGTSNTYTIIWQAWTNCTSSATSTSDTTWYDWNTTGASNLSTATYYQSGTYRQPTAEELERAAAAQRERAEKQRLADARAAELLREHLDEEQRASYERDKKFHVIAADGQRYEVDCGKRMHNVFALDEQGRRVDEFCIYQDGGTPLADNHLAQKLLLEADPVEFRRIANRTRLRAA